MKHRFFQIAINYLNWEDAECHILRRGKIKFLCLLDCCQYFLQRFHRITQILTWTQSFLAQCNSCRASLSSYRRSDQSLSEKMSLWLTPLLMTAKRWCTKGHDALPSYWGRWPSHEWATPINSGFAWCGRIHHCYLPPQKQEIKVRQAIDGYNLWRTYLGNRWA